MKHNPVIVSIIPARGGSKGVPRKNIRLLAGKPLIYYAIQPSLNCSQISHTFVSTEDEEIAQVAKDLGAEVIPRPLELAQDTTPDLPVLEQAIKFMEQQLHLFPDFIVFLRPTQPLRTKEDIEQSLAVIQETAAESVHTIHEAKEHPYWMNVLDENNQLQPFVPEGWNYARRQDLPKVYKSNGLVDVMTRDLILVKKKKRGDIQQAVITEKERGVDIDSEFDFLLAETYLRQKRLI